MFYITRQSQGKCFKQMKYLLSSKSEFYDGVSLQSKQIKQEKLQVGPSLEHFITNSGPSLRHNRFSDTAASVPYVSEENILGHGRKVYFDVHGCQMNTSDTEIAWSVLQEKGYERTLDVTDADVVLVMTCAIREGAEQKIWKKLRYLGLLKRRRPLRKGGARMKIGILGCMAERLKTKIIEQEKMVDVVCGPDAYRDLPRLLATTTHSQQAAVNVLLSLDETYADVVPVRLNEDTVTAYVVPLTHGTCEFESLLLLDPIGGESEKAMSIMRGCDNMCSYCIVPFTRGRERSRPIDSIVDEIKILSDQGVKEVTLLGQNVNSYRDQSQSSYYGNPDGAEPTRLSEGFSTIYKTKSGGRRFSDLLDKVSQVDPEMRIRFTSPHPKDFPEEVLELIKDHRNVCNQLHLPAQSGNTDVLKAMRRGYTLEAYLHLVNRVRNILPDVSLTSDFISGFCGETEEAHRDTLSLIKHVRYSMVFCYPYSMRQKTRASHKLIDDVPEDVKARRFKELAELFRQEALVLNTEKIGQTQMILVEGTSRRSDEHLFGRNDGGVGVVIPDMDVQDGETWRRPKPGDYVLTKISGATSQTLHGQPIKLTKLQDISDLHRDSCEFNDTCRHATNTPVLW